MDTFLVTAKRAVLTLSDGSNLEGKIEAVTADTLAIRVDPKAPKAPSYIATVSTAAVRTLLVKHVRARGAREARKFGSAFGFVMGASVASYAAMKGSGVGTWAALIGFPAAGAFAGDRLARRSQETLITVQPYAGAPNDPSPRSANGGAEVRESPDSGQ